MMSQKRRHVALMLFYMLLLVPAGPVGAQQFGSVTAPCFFSDSGIAYFASVQKENGDLLFWTIRNQQFCMASVDASLKTTSARSFSTARRPIATCGLTLTSDGGCAGTYLITGGSATLGGVIRFDKSGVEQWNRTLFTGSNAPRWDGQILQLQDGGFVVVSQIGGDTVQVQKISSGGDSLWVMRLHRFEATSGFRHRIMPALTPKGTFVFTVSYKSSNNPASPIEALWSIVEMDTDGKIVGEYRKSYSGYELLFMGIKPARKGGFYLCGYQKYNSSVLFHSVIRVDAEYNVMWNKFFKTLPDSTTEHFGQRMMLDIIEPDDSTFIAGGFDAAPGGDDLKFAFVAFNSLSGERIWNHMIRDNYDVSYSVPSVQFFRAADGYPVVAYHSNVSNQLYALNINKFGTKLPPRFTSDVSSLNKTIPEGSPYVEMVTAVDIFPSSKLTFSLAVPGPSSMTINDSTGVIRWTPGNGDAGVVNVTVFVSDKSGQRDTLTYRLTVTDVNSAPEFVAHAAEVIAYLGYSYRDVVRAEDAEKTPLVYSLITGPDGLTINENAGSVDWLPKPGSAGTYSVSFRVTDGTLSDSMTYTVRVLDSLPVHSANDPVSAVFDTTCSAFWKFKDGASFKLTFKAADCTMPSATLTYNGFTVNPRFPDVIGFFFDLPLNDPPAGGMISFSHSDLTDGYTFAVEDGNRWTPLSSSAFSAGNMTLNAAATTATHWVVVDKSIFSLRDRHFPAAAGRVFSVRRSVGKIFVSLPEEANSSLGVTILGCNGVAVGKRNFYTGRHPGTVCISLRSIGINDNNMYILLVSSGSQRIITKVINFR